MKLGVEIARTIIPLQYNACNGIYYPIAWIFAVFRSCAKHHPLGERFLCAACSAVSFFRFQERRANKASKTRNRSLSAWLRMYVFQRESSLFFVLLIWLSPIDVTIPYVPRFPLSTSLSDVYFIRVRVICHLKVILDGSIIFSLFSVGFEVFESEEIRIRLIIEEG